MAKTFKYGAGIWATKTGSSMAYNDQNDNYKPLPFKVERDSIATRVNKEGLIEVVGKDIPRIDYTDSSDGVLLLENSATNLVTHSEDYNNNSWTKLGNASGSVPILTSNYALSPDGTQNATRLQCNLNGGTTTSDQSIIYDIDSSNTSQTISIYLKSNNGQNQEVYLANTFGTNDTVVITSEWKRYVFTHTSSNHTFSLGSRGSTGSSDVLDILIWGAQSESGNVSSYIPTSGSTVQRAAETANGSGNSEVFNDSEGVLFADVDYLTLSGGDYFGLNDGTNNQRVLIQRQTTNIKAYINSGVELIAPISSTINKISVSYKSNNYKLYLNGFKVATNTSSSVTPSGLNAFEFELGGGFGLFAYLKTKEIGYYDTALTDEELETLTSYRSLNELVTELNLNTL